MSQEKVREILSHVDMTKIDLSSFKIGEKKFNELSHLYRNRVVISCTSVIMHKSEYPAEEVDVAFEMLQKVVGNPNFYDYDTIYANERKAVDAAIDDITTRRDRNINDVKIKAIENRMKDAYKQMRKTIELALEYGNAFEDEFNEEIVERCLQITKDAIEGSKKQAVEAQSAPNPVVEEHVDTNVREMSENAEAVEHPEPVANEHQEEPKPKKVSFWRRLFGKV